MQLEKDKVLEQMLLIPRIAKRKEELNLTLEQCYEALPIMLVMSEEDENTNENFLTSFDISSSGFIKRISVRSPIGEKKKYLENIITFSDYKVNFEDDKKYDNTLERKALLFKISDYMKVDGIEKRGLYIHGPMGVGKTFTMKRIAKKFAQNNKTVAYVPLPELVSLVKRTFGSKEDYKELFGKFINADILFLDDIGAEIIAPWFRDDFLFPILNIRMEQNKLTFFSSNHSFEQLKRVESRTQGLKYGDNEKASRLVERIQALSEPIQLTGKNRRY